jgi:hypothetical protein
MRDNNMAVGNYLPSTLLMGLFLLAIFVALARIRSSGSTSTASGEQNRASDLPNITSDVPARTGSTDTVSSETPIAWVVGFIFLVFAAGAGAILFIGDYSLPSIGAQVVGILIAGVIGGLVCGYLFSGVYISLRGHGRKSAEATAVAFWLLGLLGVAVIALKLVLAQ